MDIDQIVANSYKDFHAKGLDYICLERSEHLTIKLYFFDGDVTKAPEVVAPHDHRYNFETTVLAGEFCNRRYYPADKGGEVYQLFSYLTPLNGGNGFAWQRETRLFENTALTYSIGQRCTMTCNQIHTIKILRPGTILHLRQGFDAVPIGVPTRCFTRDREPPSLDGLYSRFTADQVIARLRQVGLA